ALQPGNIAQHRKAGGGPASQDAGQHFTHAIGQSADGCAHVSFAEGSEIPGVMEDRLEIAVGSLAHEPMLTGTSVAIPLHLEAFQEYYCGVGKVFRHPCRGTALHEKSGLKA